MKKIKNFIKSINLKEIQPHTYVSIVMVILVAINQVLMVTGKPIINCGEQQVTYWVNIVLNVVGIVYPAWKNNSLTEFAKICDTILFMLRDGSISKQELEEFIEKHKQ